jgi:GH24 family phage-related lysozyme (muramidase)
MILAKTKKNQAHVIRDGSRLVCYLREQENAEYTIPAGVTTIGSGAFSNCTSLESITIPAGVTTIGIGVFSGCPSLTTIIVERENVQFATIDGILFNKLEDRLICYPAGKETSEYTIPAGVTTIGDYAFSRCTSLESITIPAGVTTIGSGAFSMCTSLESITIPAGVTTIGISAFSNCTSLESITIPAGVTTIGISTFSNCTSLESITIPAGVTTIGDYAFYGCPSLTTIIVERENVQFATIDSILFNKPEDRLICYPAGKETSEYTIPAGVTTIGDYAFSMCTSLESITIPAGVTTIGCGAFDSCNNLSAITVEDENSRFAVIGGILFDKVENRPLYYPDGKKNTHHAHISKPDNVELIGGSLFLKSCDLTSRLFFKKTAKIENLSVSGCAIVESLMVPANLLSAGNNIFSLCKTPESPVVPNHAAKIGNRVFSGCESLESISISANIMVIGTGAFENCANLQTVYISREAIIDKNTFNGIAADVFDRN